MTTFCTPLNNVSTTLGAAYTSGGTSLVVASGQGALFGSPSPSAPVRVTVVALSALDSSGRISDRTKVAVFKATGRTADTLTGLTLDEGTAQNFAINDVVAVVNTAKTESDQHTAINALETTVATLAVDSTVVHNTGTETVAGAKTFSTAPVLASLTGILKASTGVLSAAAAGTDYLSPSGDGSALTSLNASALASGTVAVGRGGTGVTSTPANGQLLIGNGTGYTVANLTAGANITITNGGGSITIAGAGGLTVGNAVSGGGANRVLFENASQNLATDSGLTYSSSVLTAPGVVASSGGLKVDGMVNGGNGGEINFTSPWFPTARISTAYTGGALLAFDHLGTGNTGYWRWRNGTNAGSTRMTLDATGNLTIAGGLSQSGVGTFTAGVKVEGMVSGGNGGEINFSSPFFPTARISTLYAGGALLAFDHLGTGNTGRWRWRNGTNGGSLVMELGTEGLTVYGQLTLSTAVADSAAPNDTLFKGSDHGNKLCWKDSAGTVHVLY